MPCPYLEEVVMRYCKAYPMKKMIPASSSQLVSPCFANNNVCPVYKDVTGKKHRKTQPASCATCGAEAPWRPNGAHSHAQEITPTANTKDQKYCVWLRQETVSYRLCTRNYDCQSCQFEQMLIEQDGKYVEQPHMSAEIDKLKTLPAHLRKCKYTVTGKILMEPCNVDYQCWKCDKYKELRSSIIEHCLEDAKK